MQIHIVQSGDSLWNIAHTYQSSVANIIQANDIPDPNRLVVGQALVIPIWGEFYWVQPGDSLWAIGQRYEINYLTLAEINQIDANQPLRVGLRIYIPPRQRRRLKRTPI